MHVPDGLIAPEVYLGALVAAVPVWVYATRRCARDLNEEVIPQLAVLTALAFVLTTLMLPLPGGTSGHVQGVGLLALRFGLWPAFLAYSLVLLLQVLLLGVGGITAWPVNSLAMGLVGGLVVIAVFRMLAGLHRSFAIVVAVWVSVSVSATLIGLILGLQPWIAQDAAGQPLFFPFGPNVTLPALVIPHLFIGLGEGLLTLAVLRLHRRTGVWA